jgi:2-polyprenyl-6-methoxyphenol hydroxylase-like FAD-dependent oxidoreductase
VALVGDAAYAPSFLSGQGSSIALVGAYVLAGELGTRGDHREAFVAYECAVREFVRRNQALADQGAPIINPRTPEELARRNQVLRDPALLSQRDNALVVCALTLPQYALAS